MVFTRIGFVLWLVALAGAMLWLAACERVTVDPAYTGTPVNTWAYLDFRGTKLPFLQWKNDPAGTEFHVFTTSAGTVERLPDESGLLYHPTNRVLLADSVVISFQNGGQDKIAIVHLTQYLSPELLFFTNSRQASLDGQAVPTTIPSSLIYQQRRYEILRNPSHGSATLEGLQIRYQPDAGFQGMDTLMIAGFDSSVTANDLASASSYLPVVFYCTTSQNPCLSRIEAHDDTVYRSSFRVNQPWFGVFPLMRLLANDTYCQDFLDIASIRLLSATGEESIYQTVNVDPYLVNSLGQATLLRQMTAMISQAGHYRYRIRTVGGATSTANLIVLP